jgi:hypothetical protein
MNDHAKLMHHYKVARATGLDHKAAKWFARDQLNKTTDINHLRVIL